jgi:hypothetical protein
MVFRTHPAGFYAIAALCLVALGCSGGSSPVGPDARGDSPDLPREVLCAFAQACETRDVDAASALLLNPHRWRRTLELGRDALPFFGRALRDAKETRRERDCVRYRFRLSHPDDPRHRVLENTVYVARIRGVDGRVGDWGVDFTWPGDGQSQIERRQRAPARTEILPGDRSAQWGTLCTHASIMTRAVLAYYLFNYPQDSEFTGPWGYFRPKMYRFSVLATHPGPIETILFFDYDSYESMPPDAVLIANAPTALVQAGSADEDVFVGELNGDGSINYLRDIELSLSGGVRFQTTADFGDDDDTFLKGFGHFLTPLTQDAWQTEFSKFDDMELLGGIGGASVRALDWALGEGTMGPYDVLGVVDLRESRNRKTLQRAVDLLHQVALADNGIEAAEFLANSLYTFGFTMHLLEDASCPAHSRNDMHGVPIISSIPGLGSLQPDPLEEWGETLTQSFIDETIALYADLMAEAEPIQRGPDGFPADPILQHLYDTAGHSDFAAVEALFEYTALMSNRMCFSEDTIYRSTNPDAANTDYYPMLTDLDLDFFGKTAVFGTPGPPISTDEYLVACGNAMFDVWRSWFWTTHWFQDPDVEDVEDALRGGWDILTVADEDDEDYFSNSRLGVREQQWRLLFPLIVRTGAAYVHEFYLASR